jgi:polyhydroxyalkanoate synthesis regulator phasin
MAASGGTIKDMLLAGLGVFTLTRDRIESIVDGLVDRGGLKRSDAQALVEKLSTRAEQERAVLAEIVREQMSQTVSALGVVTRDDLGALARRIEAIEKLLD